MYFFSGGGALKKKLVMWKSQNTKWERDENSNREDDMEGRDEIHEQWRILKKPRPNGSESSPHIIEYSWAEKKKIAWSEIEQTDRYRITENKINQAKVWRHLNLSKKRENLTSI